jgi:hypothetical protein
MNKSKYIAAGLLAVTIVSVGITKYSIAASSEPGSSADPVVSKSYVDGKMNELKTLINSGTSNNGNASNTSVSKDQIVSEVLAVVDALYGDKSSGANTGQTGQAFVPVQLFKGKYLLGGEGTEIILRSGKASAYSENEMGVVDVSLGKELFKGTSLSENHLLIIARNDGRGVYASEDSWFMVKGSYSIK